MTYQILFEFRITGVLQPTSDLCFNTAILSFYSLRLKPPPIPPGPQDDHERRLCSNTIPFT